MYPSTDEIAPPPLRLELPAVEAPSIVELGRAAKVGRSLEKPADPRSASARSHSILKPGAQSVLKGSGPKQSVSKSARASSHVLSDFSAHTPLDASGSEPADDPVGGALADALARASTAEQWDVVARLASELQARRLARAGVTDLRTAPGKRRKPRAKSR